MLYIKSFHVYSLVVRALPGLPTASARGRRGGMFEERVSLVSQDETLPPENWQDVSTKFERYQVRRTRRATMSGLKLGGSLAPLRTASESVCAASPGAPLVRSRYPQCLRGAGGTGF